MGGMRGVKHYLQRTALQGDPTMISAVTHVYQQNAKAKESEILLFRKYFEELELELRFGEVYLEYKKTVPFLFPKFK